MNVRTKINLCILVMGLSLFFQGGCKPKEQPIIHRLIYNSDGTNVLGNFMFPQRLLTVKDVNEYVDIVANTQVTTFMMCSGSDFMYYRSKYGRVFGDDRNGTLDCGCDTARYRHFITFYRNHVNIEKEGTDIIEASLRRAKEKGMEAFITYRMNDLHFSRDSVLNCPITYTDFWSAHPEYRMNEDPIPGWSRIGALDFAHMEVREHVLNIITEQLEKYEVIDGYDLDFMRWIVYFKSYEGEKKAPLMTDLVNKIKSKVDEISLKRGKKILLSARVPTDLDFCMKKGLDVKEWVRLGLFDFISIGVHWIGNPTMPVAKFKNELGAPTIPVYASIEDGGYDPREPYTHGMFRGMASHILAQGGDGIYLFNYFFDDYMSKYNGKLHLEDSGYVCRVVMPDLLHELGSLKTLRKRNKIYCLDDGGSAAFGYKPETPLPLTVSAENFVSATIFIGDDLKKDVPEETVLFLRSDKPAQYELFINDVKVETQNPENVSLFDRERNLGKDEVVNAYTLPASCLRHGDNDVRVKSINTEICYIKRLEIAFKYGDVTTFGYF